MEKLKNAFLTLAFYGGIVFFAWGLYLANEARNRPKTIYLSNGTTIQCRTIAWGFCGDTFKDCTDGRIYECQDNYSVGG